ncbi:MAG TPA: aldo/keto reductase [Devosia sp.]|nr:aldo/keto reductase [Devosia sp.]
MERRRLGKTDYLVSEIGLGCWQLGNSFGPVDDETAEAILNRALVLGVDFWDTADVYGDGESESRIGRVLKQHPNVRVATKVGRAGSLFPDKYTRAGVRASLEGSAQRLGVETIDLAQLHCVPQEVLEDGEIFSWMDELVAEGLVRHYGASVETIEQGLLCLRNPRLATLQIIFNLFRQDAVSDLLPQAQAADVGIIVRLPLASGLLSGKFGRDQRFAASDHRNFNRDGAAFNVGETFSGIPFETGVELVSELEKLNSTGLPMAQFALRWILDHPAVSTVIAGVSRPDQLDENVAAAARPPIPAALDDQLWEFYSGRVRPTVRGGI